MQAQLALARHVIDELAAYGEPLAAETIATIDSLIAGGGASAAWDALTAALAPRLLLVASVNPEGQVGLSVGPAKRELVQGGYRLYLARIDNPSGAPGRFAVHSPESIAVNGIDPSPPNQAPMGAPAAIATSVGDMAARWLDLGVLDAKQLPAALLPLPVDFKLLQIYARDAGVHAAHISADAGAGRQASGGNDTVLVDFSVLAGQAVTVAVRDVDGAPVTCSLLVTDAQGRVYPSQTRRDLPDMYFQRRIYRADGETLSLPAGEYRVEATRGPEYLLEAGSRRVQAQGTTRWEIALRRWIDPRVHGWYSGDHHIHAAGCAHYMQPTEGVGPDVMARQVRGEGLSIGSVLTWGPGFYTQKLNFSGHDAALSSASMRLHYDLEVSGFPSSHCGHTVLLQMRGMDFPGTARIEEWPSSNAPVLRWARSQGAITGYAHSGWGLIVDSTELPNELMPAFDGIGANDYIATGPAGFVDFISACNTPLAAELNIWYHTLNAGLRTRLAGETDWPCIFDEAVGMGRSYVRIDGPLSYEAWCQGLKAGRTYVSDGRSHLMDFSVEAAGQRAVMGAADLALAKPQAVDIKVQVAARLEPAPTAATETIRALGPTDKPYWHLERARIGATRRVAVELLVNGRPVESREIEADGSIRAIGFSFQPRASCWLALRIRGSSHTNPIWVTVAGAPVRLRRSASWCRSAVDQCWGQKEVRIRESERAAEALVYDAARAYYERAMTESAD